MSKVKAAFLTLDIGLWALDLLDLTFRLDVWLSFRVEDWQRLRRERTLKARGPRDL
jgi:hypothetical protein